MFSHGRVMTLDRYFKKKTALSDPHGDLSSMIHPMVIALMNREVELTQLEASTSTGTLGSVGKCKPYKYVRKQYIYN